MPSIDERVVAMAFENAKFEAGVAKTMGTLAKLDAAIKNIGNANGLGNIEKAANKVTLQAPMSALDKLKSRFGRAGNDAAQGMSDIEKAGGKVQLAEPIRALDKVRSESAQVGAQAADGFNEIEKASGRVSLQGLNAAMDSVTAKFSVLQAAATVALGNITSQAAMKGAAFAKGFAFGPITDGLNEYKTNLNSIQTILANTADSGGNLQTVNAALNELNTYSDKTIYNFSEMAKNIGTFTAAGVRLKPATAAIKGIANLAALSGSNSQQASTAMYQLSQAIAAGKVGLQDWNSVVNAGMGGAVFQKSLMRTAVNMGALSKGAVKIDKATGKATVNGQSFRESIMAKPGQKSWLSSDVLTKTLSQFTGDLSDAQLAAQGFSQEEIKAIQKQAKTAQAAATQVKTLSQVFDVAKETIGSGWSRTFQLIFGNFGESKKTFTELSNTINGVINRMSKARNRVLGDWKKLGGRDVLIGGIKQAFKDLAAILKPIGQAFRDIFPAKTGKDLFDMTKGFADLMKQLKPSHEIVDGLRRTFKGFFAILSIGWYLVKKVGGVIATLLGIAGKGAGGFLSLTGSFGDFAAGLQQVIVKGDALKGFFKGLAGVLRVPLDLIRTLAAAVLGLFGKLDSPTASSASKSVNKLGDSLKPLGDIFDNLVAAGKKVVHIMNQIFAPISKFVSKVGHAFVGIGKEIADAFEGLDYNKVFAALQTGLIGGIFLAVKKGIGGGFDITGGALSKLNGVLGGLTGNLKAMQQSIKAATLLEIATAIGILAAGVTALSTIDPKRLTSAMTGVAIGLGELVGALAVLESVTHGRSAVSIAGIAVGLIGIATALLILAGAMKIFATMSWDDMAKGIGGVAGGLGALSLGMEGFKSIKMLVLGPGLIAVALGLVILAGAMKIMASLSWDEIGKGIAGIAGALIALATGLEVIGPEIVIVGPGLVVAALGLTMLAGAVGAFGRQKLETLAKGVAGIGTAILLIGNALEVMPKDLIIQAAGLVVLGIALTTIAGAIKVMGGMDLVTMIKGLTGLAGALLVISIGLATMVDTIPGSLALLAAAAALTVLAPVLALMGHFQWGTIFKGLAAIALVLGTLGVVGGLAAAGLIALGTGLGIVGLGLVFVGAGLTLIVKALIALGDSGVKSTGILIAAITAFIAVIPKMAIEFAKGLIEVLGEVAKLAPQIVDALVKIVGAVLQAIIDLAPKVALAVGALLTAFVKVLNDNVGPLFDAGLHLLLHFLQGISQNITEVTKNVALIITRFLTELAKHAPALAAAGGRAIIAWLRGITGQVPGIVAAAAKLIATFVGSIATHLGSVVHAAVTVILKFAQALLNGAWRLVKAGIQFVIKVLEGVANQIPQVRKAAVHMISVFLHNLARALVSLAHIAFDALINFIDGLAAVIDNNAPRLRKAMKHLAWSMADAFSFGLASKAKGAGDSILGFVEQNPKKATPTVGRTPKGGHIGKYGQFVPNRKADVATEPIDPKPAIGAIKKLAAAADGIEHIQPVITPVLDLTDIENGAKKVANITARKPVVASVSFKQADAIAQGHHAVATAAAEQAAHPKMELKFEQTNTSPEALSEVEIYRRTRNQLAQARSVLQRTLTPTA